jgi:hypothetical protein
MLAVENRSIQAKWRYSSATLPTTDSMQTGLGLNPGLCDEKLAANYLSLSLSHGHAQRNDDIVNFPTDDRKG